MKDKLWGEMQSAVNSLGSANRKPKEYKTKWSNKLQRAKLQKAEQEAHNRQTDGAPPPRNLNTWAPAMCAFDYLAVGPHLTGSQEFRFLELECSCLVILFIYLFIYIFIYLFLIYFIAFLREGL